MAKTDTTDYVDWTAAEDAALFDAVTSGTPISKLVLPGRTYQALRSRMHRLGLTFRRSKGKTAAVRPCICCKRIMMSDHVGHRICMTCRTEHSQYAA
jgi:dihydrofolate reductase